MPKRFTAEDSQTTTEEGRSLPKADYAVNTDKESLRKSILRIAAVIVLILALIATGAVLFVSIKTYYFTSKQTEDYNQRAAVIQADIKDNLAAVNDKFAVERLNKFFTRDEIYSFAYNLWKYELLLNGAPVGKSASALTIKQGDVISVKEALTETLLPEEFLEAGKLTRGDKNDSLKNHFGLNKKIYDLTEKKEGLTTIYTVENLRLASGERFNLLLSVQLQERLTFDSDVIAVTVN